MSGFLNRKFIEKTERVSYGKDHFWVLVPVGPTKNAVKWMDSLRKLCQDQEGTDQEAFIV